MTQGGAYNLPVTLKIDDADININLVRQVEFMFDTIRKVYGGTGTVTYDGTQFIIPLSQEETFTFNRMIPYQARILWADGLVSSTEIYTADISESISQVVLE